MSVYTSDKQKPEVGDIVFSSVSSVYGFCKVILSESPNDLLSVKSLINGYETDADEAAVFPVDHGISELWIEKYYACKLQPVWDGNKSNITEEMVVFLPNSEEIGVVTNCNSPSHVEVLTNVAGGYTKRMYSDLRSLDSPEYKKYLAERDKLVSDENDDQQAPKVEIIKTFPKVSACDDLVWVSRKNQELRGSGCLKYDNELHPNERQFCISTKGKLSILNVKDFAIIQCVDNVKTAIMIDNLRKQLPHLSDADIYDLINQIRSCPAE